MNEQPDSRQLQIGGVIVDATAERALCPRCHERPATRAWDGVPVCIPCAYELLYGPGDPRMFDDLAIATSNPPL